MSQPPHDPNWPGQPGRGSQPPGNPPPNYPPPGYQPPSYPPPNYPPPSYPPPSSPPPGGQPGWGSQQPPYPTQRLPPYQPPGGPTPGQWGGPPPPPPAPPGSPWGSPPPPRRSNTTMIVVLAIVGVLVVVGAATGIILASSGKKKHDSQPTTPPTGATGLVSTHDFPTTLPTDLPTSGGDSADQEAIAHNAETVLHAIGDSDTATFCPLIDPADLKRLLKEKSLTNCNQIALKSSADKAEYKGFTVDDPAEITVTGNTAHIPAAAISPASFGAVDMRRDTDGNWKFRFYSG